MRFLRCIVFLAFFPLAAHAADKEKFDTLPEPPPPVKNYKAPPQPAAKTADTSGDALPEPEVHITTQGGDRREEYRMGGKLYMIKVTPKKGRPYYLIDKQGKGEFVKDDLQQGISPPTWVIKNF